MKLKSLFAYIMTAALALGLLAGCAAEKSVWRGLPWLENEITVSGDAAYADTVAITLSDCGSSCAESGVVIDGSTVTITEAGDYLVSGSLSDGQIIVDAGKDAKVRLILDGVRLVKTGSAAIWAQSAEKLVLSSAADSENLLQSRDEFDRSGDDKVDAAVYAACDLTLSGEGVLNVSCLTGHALVSGDDLMLRSGTVNLEAAKKGLYGKDSVTVEGGSLNVDVGADALCADSGEQGGKGTITVEGGVLNLLAQKDGLDASGDIVLSGGVLTVSAGSGQEGKGLAADGSIEVSGSSLILSAVEDAIHASGDVTLSGGVLELVSGDDGVHADSTLTVTGGTIVVNAGGDGVDSKGSLRVSGGTLCVSGPTHGANSALHYGTEATITGGAVIALGAADTAVNFGAGSTQGSILLKLNSTQEAGTLVAVCDEKGRIIASFEAEKPYSAVVISAPGLREGGCYSVMAGTELYDITLDSRIYGSGGMMGGRE